MAMKLAGKSAPEKEQLELAKNSGFERIELYLEKNHLDNFSKTLNILKDSKVEIASVHTPHVAMDEKSYFQKADKLAKRFDAYLVVHSQHILNVELDSFEDVDFSSRHGFENNPGTSVYCLENSVLEKDRELVLDNSHLFMASENYREDLSHILRNYSDQIRIIHLSDSTVHEDGLGFGEGDIDIEKTIERILESGFDGFIVLEVMPGKQENARKKFEEYKP